MALILLVFGCGGEDPAPAPSPPVQAGAAEQPEQEADPTTPEPRHGGTVIAVGPYHVEVLAHSDGEVEAFVHPGGPPPTETSVAVRITAEDGAMHPVVLTWDPSEERHRGPTHHGAPIPGPMEVSLTHGGETHRGRSPRLVVTAPTPRSVARARSTAPAEPDPEPEPDPEQPAAAPIVRDPTPAPAARAPAVTVRPEVAAPRSVAPAAPGRLRVPADRRARATGARPSRGRSAAPGQVTVRVRE